MTWLVSRLGPVRVTLSIQHETLKCNITCSWSSDVVVTSNFTGCPIQNESISDSAAQLKRCLHNAAPQDLIELCTPVGLLPDVVIYTIDCIRRPLQIGDVCLYQDQSWWILVFWPSSVAMYKKNFWKHNFSTEFVHSCMHQCCSLFNTGVYAITV